MRVTETKTSSSTTSAQCILFTKIPNTLKVHNYPLWAEQKLLHLQIWEGECEPRPIYIYKVFEEQKIH